MTRLTRNPLRARRRCRVSFHCWACLVGLAAALAIAFSATSEATAKEGSQEKQRVDEGAAKAVSLFNGKNLDGWVQRGGKAKYTIEGDEVVGTSVPNTPNSFLCTDRDYSDFILEVDFKVDDGLNSGIQIRSQCFDKETELEVTQDGKQKQVTVPAGRVHGYQVEIDPSDRSWSAGIYDEARRGWLYKLDGPEHEQAREAFKNNAWNHYKIECRGDTIKTWINGVPAADLKDGMTSTGLIALQVHGIPDKKLAGKQIRWKNIMLTDLSKK